MPSSFGGRIDPLEAYSGKPVLLVFWTTSCGICQRQLPLLNGMSPEFRDRGISIIAIHLGDEQSGRSYLSSQGIGLTMYADPDGDAASAYRVRGVPTLVLLTADHKIKHSSAGYIDAEGLREWMDSLRSS